MPKMARISGNHPPHALPNPLRGGRFHISDHKNNANAERGATIRVSAIMASEYLTKTPAPNLQHIAHVSKHPLRFT